MMAVAAWLVWRQTGFAGAKLPLALFAVQLALNSLWSVLFFGLQRPGLAAVKIVLLWAAILASLIAFWGRSRWAGWLLVPYLAWVSFAAVLNVADLADERVREMQCEGFVAQQLEKQRNQATKPPKWVFF